MTKQTLLIAIAACLAGFIGGFMFANSLNRSELAAKTLQAQQPVQGPAGDAPTGPPVLTPDEIKAKIESADKNPSDLAFQKSLGLSLYRYASVKQDAALLPETIRIMQRALDLDPADRDLQIGLGNAHFDVGYFKKENASFERARVFYNRALERVPADVGVRTDLALTYFLQEPPDLDKAVEEFETALKSDPKHERSLQFLVQTHIKRNDSAKANEVLERLRSTNPTSPAISELADMIAGAAAVAR
jgi:tetratricopeptide (TPR) repeat protein